MSLGRYTSKFVASDGTKYGVEITYHNLHRLTDSDILEEVTLSADPVRIYYSSESKLDPIVQSRATVELVSPRDGMYHHLYSLLGRDVRLEVYTIETRERWEYPDDADYSGPPVQTIKEVRGATIWIGTIDPESYQEPYTSADGYTVQMSFSDLGALKRQRHRLSGRMSVRSIIQEMLNEAQFRVALQLHSGELQDIEVLGYEPASLHARTSTGIETNGVRVGIFDAGYIDTALFFSSEGEPWPCYRVLEETLRPFRLRLEQRGGVYHINDNNTLSRDIAELTRSRGEDAILMSDRIYNNVALSTDPRLEQSEVRAPEVELSDAIVYTPVPRIDVGGFTAYEVRTELYTAGTLKVQTRPATTGEAMTAIALYYDPSQTQGLYRSTPTTMSGTLCYRVREEREGISSNGYLPLTVENEPNKPIATNVGSLDAKPNLPKRLIGFGKEYEHSVADNRRVFSDSSRRYEAVTSFSFPLIGQIDRGLYHLELGAELLVGVGKSLYQSVVEEESFAKYDLLGHRVSKPSKDRELYADFERAEVFFTVEGLDKVGVRVAHLKKMQPEDNETHYRFRWVLNATDNSIEHIRLMFGGVDGLKPNAWAKAKPYTYDQVPEGKEHETLRMGHRRWEELWGNALGLIIPLPLNEYNVAAIRVTLYSGVRLQCVGGEGRGDIVINNEQYTLPKFYERMYQEGLIAPNYVLIRNLSMRLSRSDGRRPNENPSTTHAYINADAYEPIEQTLMLSTNPDVEAYSPARLRDKNGKPLGANALTVEGAERTSITGTIAELYATSVASLYGKRGHIIEGTYRIRRAPTVIGYVGRRYMVLREEIDLRDSKSRLTMATFSPDEEKPTFYTPKKKKQ